MFSSVCQQPVPNSALSKAFQQGRAPIACKGKLINNVPLY